MAKTSSSGTLRSMADGGRRSGRLRAVLERGLLSGEREIAVLEDRNDAPIGRFKGKRAEVSIADSSLGRAVGGRVTHNHPEASNYPLTMLTLSPADLEVALQRNLKEMVAVTKHRGSSYRHVVRRRGKSWPPGMAEAVKRYARAVKRKGADPHGLLSNMARELGFSYSRTTLQS